jgi:hypothetical protein
VECHLSLERMHRAYTELYEHVTAGNGVRPR